MPVHNELEIPQHKNEYLQSLVDNLDRRLSMHTSDEAVLEAMSSLTSPRSIHALSMMHDNSEQQTVNVNELIETVWDWFNSKTVRVKRVSDTKSATGNVSHAKARSTMLSGITK